MASLLPHFIARGASSAYPGPHSLQHPRACHSSWVFGFWHRPRCRVSRPHRSRAGHLQKVLQRFHELVAVQEVKTPRALFGLFQKARRRKQQKVRITGDEREEQEALRGVGRGKGVRRPGRSKNKGQKTKQQEKNSTYERMCAPVQRDVHTNHY